MFTSLLSVLKHCFPSSLPVALRWGGSGRVQSLLVFIVNSAVVHELAWAQQTLFEKLVVLFYASSEDLITSNTQQNFQHHYCLEPSLFGWLARMLAVHLAPKRLIPT